MSEIRGTRLTDLREVLSSALRGVEDPVERARKDFAFYLENVVRDERQDAQSEYIRLQPIHYEIIEALTNPELTFIIIEAPRGAGKSTLVNAWCAWEASRDPTLRFILAAKTDNQSVNQLDGIEAILRSSEHQRIFGNLIPDRSRFTRPVPWSEQKRTLVRPRFSRFPTFLAVGAESQLVDGMRSDRIIIDDLIDIKTALSPAQSESVRRWLTGSLLPTRDPRGSRVVMVGTPKTRGDIYEYMHEHLRGEPYYKRVRHPAIHYDRLPDGTIRRRSYWPSVFPLEKLDRIKNEDELDFQIQYMLERLDTSSSYFKREHLQFIHIRDIPPREELTVYQGIDAHGGKESTIGDYLALATIGFDKNNVGYLLDLLVTRGDIQTIFNQIRSEILRWSPKIISVEVGSNQYHFKNHLESELGVSLNGVLTGNIAKDLRIRQMAKYFIRGSILVASTTNPDSGELEPIPSLQPFIDQWVTYPRTKNDDALDAINIALDPAVGYGVPLASATINPKEMLKDHGSIEQDSEEKQRLRELRERHKRSMMRWRLNPLPQRLVH